MEKRWYHFKLLCKEATEYSPKMWGWLVANIVVSVSLPLAQLLLSAQVISWLMEGLGINEYLIDRKSTRLNSSHVSISYAVFCLKKKNTLTCHRSLVYYRR